MKKNLRTIADTLSAIIFVVAMAIIVKADPNSNGTRLSLGSELTYYLNVKYDGIDKSGTNSNDTTIVNVKSDIIEVSDKLPDGLTFKDFKKISSGTFTSNKRNDNATGLCDGFVIDDTNETSYTEGTWNSTNTEYTYHGLHYNKNTNEVTFKVKGLTAGCQISVGIVTTVPDSADDPNTTEKELRKDFYNTATIKDGNIFNKSNTLHNFIIEESTDENDTNIVSHKVKYTFDNDNCKVLGDLPTEKEYVENSNVSVEQNYPNQETMEFLGWESSDVTITDGKFIMPDKDVTFVGKCKSITIPKYKVTYEIDGDVPDGFILPYEKEYKKDELVKLDSFDKGQEYKGYEFLGWETNDITISTDKDFRMPEKDVVIKGKFKLITYKVSYEFTGDLPSNHSSLLPASQNVAPDTDVTLPTIEDQELYVFLGWNKEDFTMPKENVTITGEWMKVTGKYTPEIKIEILDKQEEYKKDDIIKYQVTVSNKEDFSIYDVVVSEINAKIAFPDELNKINDIQIQIPEIEANEDYVFTYEYKVTKDDLIDIENTVEILSANTLNNYVLEKTDAGIKASVTAKIKVEEEKPIPIIDDIPKIIDDIPKVIKKITEIPATFDPIGRYIMLFCISTLGIGIALYKLKKDKKFKTISLTSVFLLILTVLMSYHGTASEQSVFTSLSNTFFSPNSYSEYTEPIREVTYQDEDGDYYTIKKEAYWIGKDEALLKVSIDSVPVYTGKWDKVIVGTDVSSCKYDLDKTFTNGEANNSYQKATKELLEQIGYEYDTYQTFTYNGLTTEQDNKTSIGLNLRNANGTCQAKRTQSNYGMDLFNAMHTAVNGQMTYTNKPICTQYCLSENANGGCREYTESCKDNIVPNYKKSDENILILLIDSGESYISNEEEWTTEVCEWDDNGGCGGGEMDGGGGGSCGSGEMKCHNVYHTTAYLNTTKSLIKQYFPNATIISVRKDEVDNGRNYPKHFADDKYTTNETGDTSYTLLNDLYIKGMRDTITLDLDDIITDAFDVNSVKDISANIGNVSLTKDNGKDKVVWKFNDRVGTKKELTIKLKLDNEYKDSDSYLPTNDKLYAKHKLGSASDNYTNTMTKTPVLSHMYNVIYDNNTPSGCNISATANERHIVYDTVAIKNTELSCDGYNFRGWEIATDGVKKVTDNSFIMPEKDVTIRATWGKSSITKTNAGSVWSEKTTGNLVELLDYKSKRVAYQDQFKTDDPDGNIRYIGLNPNNYVKFNNETWRIIGVFEVDDGTGNTEKRVKLIRNESLGNFSYCSTQDNDGYGQNNWVNSFLNWELNSNASGNSWGYPFTGYLDYTNTSGTDWWYDGRSFTQNGRHNRANNLTEESQSMIDNAKWYLLSPNFKTESASILNTLSEDEIYQRERETGSLGKVCSYGDYCNDRWGSAESWTGLVGLIYPSDYKYAESTDGNWLHMSGEQHTISPSAHASWATSVISINNGSFKWANAADASATRPSVYLKSNIEAISGDGSIDNPYIIQIGS